METPKALVLTGFGLNTDYEMWHSLGLAGADAKRVHVNDLILGKDSLDSYQIVCIPGGFSFGDDLGSGRVLGNKLKYNLREQIDKFISDGKLLAGICNGFQTIIKMGLVPAFDKDYRRPVATLTFNDSGRFENRWVHLKGTSSSNCVWTKGIDRLDVVVRHGEGKLVPASQDVLKRMSERNHVVFRYCAADGEPTMEYPMNPNGAVDAIAGICDETGRVFGMMPHPEAHNHYTNNPRWPREKLPEEGAGVRIFRNAVEYVKEKF